MVQGDMLEYVDNVDKCNATIAVSYVVVNIMELQSDTYKNIALVLIGLYATGFGGFLANTIQFAIDQLPYASTAEITSFVSWCAWSVIGSSFIVFLLTCLCQDYRLPFVCVGLSIVLSSNFVFRNYLIKEPITQNLFSLILK